MISNFLHFAVAVRAIGGGIVALALTGVWFAFIPGPSAVVAALATGAAAVLLTIAGVMALLVDNRPTVARAASRIPWVAFPVGLIGAVVCGLFVEPLGLLATGLIVVLTLATVIVCTNVGGAPQREEEAAFAVFPPLE